MPSTTTATPNNPQPQPSAISTASADLAAQLAAPVSPTTDKSRAEAQRRTSVWAPPAKQQRTHSFDAEDHKHAMMMAASSTLTGSGPAAAAQPLGFSERT